MARKPLKPLIRGGGGFYPSKKWTPLVYNGGYTTEDGGEEPSDPLNTFTGKIVQFLASAVKPIVNLTATLEPIQSGSGDPSPTNVRPISGHTGVMVHVADGENPHVVDNEYPITFPDAAGTVYGGTLSVNEDGSGTLTVTMIGITVDTTKVNKENDGWNTEGLNVFWISISSYGKGKYIYSSTVSNILANMCVATSYNGLKSTEDFNKIAFTGQGNYLEWTSPSTTLNEEKTRLTNTPMQIVYELATPLVYNLTAEQVGAVITTLKGNNVMWVDDSDEISVTAYGTEVE